MFKPTCGDLPKRLGRTLKTGVIRRRVLKSDEELLCLHYREIGFR